MRRIEIIAARQQARHCACGRPAVAFRRGDFVCQHCLDIEEAQEHERRRIARRIEAEKRRIEFLPLHLKNAL